MDATKNKSASARTKEASGRATGPLPWWASRKMELAIAAFFLIYVLARIFKVSLGGDEWGILFRHSKDNYGDIILFKELDAQGAFVNYFLTKVCLQFCPFDEVLAIRVPAGLSFLVMLGASLWIKRQIQQPLMGLIAYVALLCNAFLLDYFALSRGYGPATAFITLSLAGLMAMVKEGPKPRWLGYVTIWSAGIAILCHVSFLFFYITVFGAMLLLWLSESSVQTRWTKRAFYESLIVDNLYLIANAAILGVFYLPRIVLMGRSNEMHYDGRVGFVVDTVVSLIKCVYYDTNLPEGILTGLAWGAVLLSCVLGIASLRRAWQSRRWNAGALVWLCTLTTMLMFEAAHRIMDVDYPIERHALFFYPAFIVQIVCGSLDWRERWPQMVVGAVLAAYSFVGLTNLNLTHECRMKFLADAPKVVDDLVAIHERTGKPIVLCMSDGAKWSVWYYAEKAMKFPDSERIKERGCAGTFGWLTFYEIYCGRPHDGRRAWIPQTTHLWLAPEDYPPDWVPSTTGAATRMGMDKPVGEPRLIAEYPLSERKLYSLVPEP